MGSLYGELIRALNAEVSPTMRLHELECTAIWMLRHAAPRMIMIDEIQHLLSCNAREQRAALNALKFLANQLRVSVVAAGTNEALHLMRYDPQIASRFEQLELPVWRESDELRRFIAGYLALLPVRKVPAALDRRFVEYIVELTDGVTGRIVDVLRRAAMQVMTERPFRVGLAELQFVGARLPQRSANSADFR
jgi:Bacterial TniB protein